jgi:hypothetical protein
LSLPKKSANNLLESGLKSLNLKDTLAFTLPQRGLRIKSVSLWSAQPTEILGTKLKLSRQRALGMEFEWILGRSNFGLAGATGYFASECNG